MQGIVLGSVLFNVFINNHLAYGIKGTIISILQMLPREEGLDVG